MGERGSGSVEEALAEIVAAAREWVVWEWFLGGGGVPIVGVGEAREAVGGWDEGDGGDAGAEAGASGAPADEEAGGAPTWGGAGAEAGAAAAGGVAAATGGVAAVAGGVAAATGGVAAATGGVPAATGGAAAAAGHSPTWGAAEGAVAGEGGATRGVRLARLAEVVAGCTACRLAEGRTQTVFARGSAEAEVAFVGEGPGFHEDQQGAPFVGPAGQLLDRMVGAMGYGRDEVYVCNVVKCRPPENRTPLPDEAAACAGFLRAQLETVAPRVIVALGKCAAENLGCLPARGRWRGVWGEWNGIPVMPTYHPAFLLRSPEMKRPVWEDLQAVLGRLGRPVPPPRGASR